jgi:V8-like Glu-specific endopeptidase
MAKRSNEFGILVGRVGRLLGVVLFVLSTGVTCGAGNAQQRLSHSELIKASKESCVRVVALRGSEGMVGSGFFIEPNLVVTCFHVITEELPNDPNTKKPDYTKWRPYPNIHVVTEAEEDILSECISPPALTEPDAHRYDFAILRLKRRPMKSPRCVPLYRDMSSLIVGDDIYLSGFPLDTPVMLTHKGMLSGFTKDKDQALLCIQAPISQGNSGGALLNTQGEVLGVISFRLGGIGPGLDQLRTRIKKMGASVAIGGINVLDTDKAIIDVLDRTISTGVGYAINAKYLRDYIQKRALMKPAAGTK